PLPVSVRLASYATALLSGIAVPFTDCDPPVIVVLSFPTRRSSDLIVPVPSFVRPPVPEATPEYAVELLSPPALSVFAPRVTVPVHARGTPVSSPVVVRLAVFTTALVSAIAVPFTDSEPAVIVVVPV